MFDPARDLRLERLLPVPIEAVWAAYTVPARLIPWFCPRPWRVVEAHIDPVPGGIFHAVMRGPDGDGGCVEDPGCILIAEAPHRLVWTSGLGPEFRPAGSGLVMTADLRFAREGTGTRLLAIVRHRDQTARDEHDRMGFAVGWNAAWDQLVQAHLGTLPP